MKSNGTGKRSGSRSHQRVRYAVVGLGHIAQVAVLPAFAHARENSELVAFVSSDPVKHARLGKRYGVEHHFGYEDYDECLESGEIDAVYIALPNHLHYEYTVRAAAAGIHVLCEKPLAVTSVDAEEMVDACARGGVKLMTAYRLHFERSNLKAIQLLRQGKLGDLRAFNSLFAMQVRPGNIRLRQETGGGTLYDIGIYCINAARYLFGAEPDEVVAFSANNGEERFAEVDEMTSAILRFPGERLATFTASFGAADLATYDVIGTRGSLRLSQAYEYSEAIELEWKIGGVNERRRYARRDQFAPELIYFSNCILQDRQPEPSGVEGLIDVQIIEALYESAAINRVVALDTPRRRHRPNLRQEMRRPPVREPEPVHALPPTRG